MNNKWFVLPLVFLAGFVDSIAGGGGLISLPAYFATGIPQHMALGTNKLSSTVGTTISTMSYAKKGYVQWPTAGVSVVGALAGSVIGANIALLVSGNVLSYIMIGAIPIMGGFILFNKGFGLESGINLPPISAKSAVLAGVIGFAIGVYDGFFGPGTGTFLIIAFVSVLNMPVLTASGNSKVVNLASNVGAVATFIINGQVDYSIGLPAALCSVLGNYIGAQFAMKKGINIIKPVMILVIIILLIKIISDLL